MDFVESEQCRSGRLCFLCRSDNRFQQALGKIPNCPRGLPFGATREQMPQEWKDFWIASPKIAAAPRGPLRRSCRFMEETKAVVEGRPCFKCYVICRNPDSPIHGQEKVWWKSACNPQVCKFYAETP